MLQLAGSELLADAFIDDAEGLQKPHVLLTHSETAEARDSASGSAATGPAVDGADPEIARAFSAIHGMIRDDLVKRVKAVYIFDLKGCVPSVFKPGLKTFFVLHLLNTDPTCYQHLLYEHMVLLL